MTWQDDVATLCPWTGSGPCRLDLEEGRIAYAADIRGGQDRHVITGPEEVARAYLIHRLVAELGYSQDRIEIERSYRAGRRGQGKRPRVDLILSRPDGRPYFFVETKEPGGFEAGRPEIETQLFAVAGLHEKEVGHPIPYLVYWTIDTSGGKLGDKVVVIDHETYRTYAQWQNAGEPSAANVLWDGYGVPRRVPYIKGGERDLTTDFRMKNIDALAANLHNVLWGGGATGDTEVFTSLVNLILAKIQDEYDSHAGYEYKFQVLMRGAEAENDAVLFERINGLYRRALEKQLGKRGDLSDQWVVNREKFSASKVRYTVEQLERYALVDGKESLTGRDILGEFFERIQRDGFKQTKGQFFTPPNIVRFMLYALELDQLAVERLGEQLTLPYIVDPSCGSATFLIEAMRMVTSEIKGRRRADVRPGRSVDDRFGELFEPTHREHKWARDYIYGVEHNFDLATAAKVNMILHGDGSSNIFHADGLASFPTYAHQGHTGERLRNASRSAAYGDLDVNGRFDVVVSNPPFSVDLDNDTKRSLGRRFLFSDRKNSENLFIERYYQLLHEGGRMAIVLPESVFDTTENKYIRLFLFWYFDVLAVVSLPQLSFQPYTQTKTSVLFARKKSADSVAEWARAWGDARNEWGRLKTRALNYLKVHIDGDDPTRFPSIAGRGEDEIVADIGEITGTDVLRREGEAITDFLERHAVLVREACEADAKPESLFGACNTTWVFRKVVQDHPSSIFAAEASEVGYKRSQRRVMVRQNDLYDVEVAPSHLDLVAIRSNLGMPAEAAATALAEIRQRRNAAVAERAAMKVGTSSARLDERIQKLEEAIQQNEAKNQALEAHRDSTMVAIQEFYDEGGALKTPYADRTEPRLKALFSRPDLMPYRSSSLITSRSEPRTILESMRRANLWRS